jgi:hypothetical protein
MDAPFHDFDAISVSKPRVPVFPRVHARLLPGSVIQILTGKMWFCGQRLRFCFNPIKRWTSKETIIDVIEDDAITGIIPRLSTLTLTA